MTEISTHLFYGVFATTSSLLIASKAFSRVQSPFLAIDLILSRKLNSTLQVQVKRSTRSNSGNGDITRFPEEIWGMIKHELIGIELVESEKELAQEFLCLHCSSQCQGSTCLYCQNYPQVSNPFLPVPINWKELSLRECEWCRQYHFDTLDQIFGNGWNEKRERVNVFLAAYALELIGLGRIETSCLDFELLSPIGITKNLNQFCKPFDQGTPFHSISSLSSTALDLPSSPGSIARRFATLKEIYGVKFGDHKTKTKDTQKTSVADGIQTSAKSVEGDKRTHETPIWHIWTRGDDLY